MAPTQKRKIEYREAVATRNPESAVPAPASRLSLGSRVRVVVLPMLGMRIRRVDSVAMRIRRTANLISLELRPEEALVLLDELAHVRGGARLPKLRQVCLELEAALTLEAERKNNVAREEARLARRTKKQENIS